MDITQTSTTGNNAFQELVFTGLLELFLTTVSTSISFLFSTLQTLLQAALFQATGTSGLFGS